MRGRVEKGDVEGIRSVMVGYVSVGVEVRCFQDSGESHGVRRLRAF